MLIDWFTVGAQALNFLVLVWLLKRFLYRPIYDAIAAREGRIARQIADAAETRRGAAELRQAFVEKTEAFELERSTMMEQAVRDADAERERLIASARQAGDELSAKRQQTLRSEAAQLHSALGQGARHEVFEITRRVLADLATASLEERLADVFIRRLGELDSATRDGLAADLTAPGGQAVIRSAFELPKAQRTAIQEALRNCLKADITLEFITAPDLVSGIELIGSGRKLAWTIDQYLEAMQRSVAELMVAANPSAVSKVPAAEAAAAVPDAPVA